MPAHTGNARGVCDDAMLVDDRVTISRSGPPSGGLVGYRSAVWFAILGHLAVRRADGADVPIPGPARRQVLAALLCRPGAVVTIATLVEDLWGSAPPRSAVNSLRSHVVRLRAALAQGGDDNPLVTVGDGYRLDIAPGDVDAGRFEALVEEAGRTSDAAAAIERYDHALALWRGEPYVEFGDAPFAVLERIRLTELRALARDRRTDLALSAGAADELVGDLEQRVRAEPYRERGWEQLALALYRAGRQADALSACRRARHVLLDDLGVDPGPGLQTLEQRLLQQDPGLLASAPHVVTAQVVLDRCPYLGLAGYQEQDAELFVGRERLTSMLAGRLADQSVVVVTGASGVGKSSLVRAGLVPALRSGALPGSSAWRIDVRTPSSEVLAEQQRRPDLLVLDQAEELFTSVDPADREDLVRRLDRYVEHDHGRLAVVLRSDFFGLLADVESLAPFAEKAAVLVGPMRADELRRALVEPAARAGLRLEDELVETIMDDVAGQAEPLPLLSEAMVRTWRRREGDLLTLDAYERSGELAGALEAAAEECYARLDDGQQRAARHLLVRLAARGDIGWVRRSVTLVSSSDDVEQQALAALIAARLVVADGRRIEIAHEALLAHWPRLREWLDERSLAAELLQHLDQAAADWRTAGQQDSDLYRGPRLSAASDWRTEHPEDLSPAEHEFIDASERLGQAELQTARAQTHRLRSVAIAAAAVAVLAIAGGIVALAERGTARTAQHRAEQSAIAADARRLAALSGNATDTETASQLALAGYRLQDTHETRSALLAAVEGTKSALWRLPFPGRVFDVSASADGSRVVVGDNSSVTVVNGATHQQVARFPMPAPNEGIAGVTADGRQIVVSGWGDTASPDAHQISVLDVPSGKVVRVLPTSGTGFIGDSATTSDGRWLVVATTKTAGHGGVVDVFDSHDWTAPPRQFTSPSPPLGVAVGRTAVAVEESDGAVEVRALPSLRALGALPATAATPDGVRIAVSADGRRVARADPSDPARVDVHDIIGRGTAVTRLPDIPAGGANAMAFSPDGSELAVGAIGGPLGVYSSADGSEVESFPGNGGQLFDVAWTGDASSSALYSVGLDGELVSWDVSPEPRPLEETGPDYSGVRASTIGTSVSAHGTDQVAALGNPPGTSAQWRLAIDLRTGKISRWPLAARRTDVCCAGMTVSSDGHLALESVPEQSGATRNAAWDLRTNKVIWQMTARDSSGVGTGYLAAILNPAGTRAYVGLTSSRVAVYALPSGRYLRSFSVSFPGAGSALVAVPWAFDPAGRLLVFGSGHNGPDNRLGLVDVSSGKLVEQVAVGDIEQPMSQAWSNDGRLLAVGTWTGTLFLLDADTLAVRGRVSAAEPGPVRSISFSPDDQTMVTTGETGQVDFWTVSSLVHETHLTIGDGRVYAWYNATGRLVGLAPDPTRPGKDMYRWFVFRSDPASLAAEACTLAGGDITRTQWQRYVGDQPYQHTCPGAH